MRKIDKVEDVFLKATPTKTRTCLKEFRTDATIRANRLCYLTDICTSDFTKSGYRVNGTDPLSQKSIRSELGKLTAPKIGTQNFLSGDPMPIDRGQSLNSLLISTSNQHPVRRLKVINSRTFSKKFRVRQH